MAKTRAQKNEIVQSLTDAFAQAKLTVLSDIKGMTVAESEKLRADMRAEQVRHHVVKISLLKLALHKVGIRTDHMDFRTQVAISYSDDDTAAARILKNFSKTNDHLKLLGGYLERSWLDSAAINALAVIPTRGELLRQLVSVLAAPLRGLVTVLSGSHRGLVQVLSQVRK